MDFPNLIGEPAFLQQLAAHQLLDCTRSKTSASLKIALRSTFHRGWMSLTLNACRVAAQLDWTVMSAQFGRQKSS